MRLLLIEDDEWIVQTLEEVLSRQHYVVDVAMDGEVGWEFVEAFTYDLILLDVILPELDGIEFCRRLRARGYQTPVLLLTAQSSSTDKVMGLDAGADDYVVKPFELTELLARIRVLLRRRHSPLLSTLEWENLRLDPGTCEVTYNERSLPLTPKEYRLLELFLRNQHHVFSRSAIIENLWSVEEAPSEDTVTAHMKGLRHKLKQAGAPADFIETVYGIGYRLKVPISSSPKSTQASTTTPQQALQKQTQTALTLMWHKHHDKARDRIAVLEQAEAALQADAMERKLRQKAVLAAHKLAGALGVFGFAEGSQIAGEIEQQLQSTATFSPKEVAHFSKRVNALRQSLAAELPQPQARPARQLRPLLIAVDDDPALAELILREALALKIRAKLLPNLAAARQTLETLSQAEPTLDVLVLSFSLATTAEANLRDLAQLANQPPPVPVLLFTDRDNLTDRVKVAQFGAHVVIQKPQRPAQVLATVTSILNRGQATNAKVMVVDDDPQVLAAIRSLFEPWGLELIALNDPFQFWAMLEKFSPDLLVLDVEMPHFSGIELCQVVRNDPRWFRLPILFFSVHTDTETVRQVLTAGADEYVSKTTVSSELVTRVLNRLERVRLLQSMR